MGFVGPEKGALLADLGVDLDERGNVARDDELHDQRRRRVQRRATWAAASSLIVWAIAEGRAAAAGVDAYLPAATCSPARSTRRTAPSRPLTHHRRATPC